MTTSGDTPPRDGASESRALVPDVVVDLTPSVPPDVTAAEAAELQKRATEIVAQLESATGSKEMELSDSVSAVGIQAQRSAGSSLNLLRGRVGELLSGDETGAAVTRDLVELRETLNEINPNESRSGIGQLMALLPFGDKLVDALERISIRYETVSKQVLVIERRLDEGRLMLQRDNIELRKLYESVESQQSALHRNVYLGEILMSELQRVFDATTDARKRERIKSLLYDVSMRVQDLRSMDEVNNQFFVSIEMTRENNTRLSQAVERTLALATNTLTIGLAIQSALSRQKRVLEATERTREFLGELIVSNAAAINRYTNEIGDVYNQPVIAIEKLTQAHNELIEALDTASRLKTEGIDIARENIRKLADLTTQIQDRVGGLPTPEVRAVSLEA
jgi:uncharacterized protein YaaN involved in tellurite resistance